MVAGRVLDQGPPLEIGALGYLYVNTAAFGPGGEGIPRVPNLDDAWVGEVGAS